MTNPNHVRGLIDKLDGWIDKLAAPLLPPHRVDDGQCMPRLELKYHKPHTVMIAKCVRAVSGLRASLLLAESGYVTECGALLRIISDFCTEITAVGAALEREGGLPRSVKALVDHYFARKPKTPEQFQRADRPRHTSREQLLKEVRRFLAEKANVDNGESRAVFDFLNMIFDGYVHGAYETTMELYGADNTRFMMRGHPDSAKRQEFVHAVRLKLHEVVCAIELTAAVTAQQEVRQAARNLINTLDSSRP